jgi:hypothetical protein
VWSQFSEKIIDSRQTVGQTTAKATRKGRHKQKMYQSQFLGSSIALESFSITAKILASRTLQPIAGQRQPDWKMRVHLQLRFSDLVPGHYKIMRYPSAVLYPRLGKPGSTL